AVLRRVPRTGICPDDARGPAPARRRPPASRQHILGVSCQAPKPRRLARLPPARPDPAVALVSGGRGPALFGPPPEGRGPAAVAADRPCVLAGAGPGPARRLPALDQLEAD